MKPDDLRVYTENNKEPINDSISYSQLFSPTPLKSLILSFEEATAAALPKTIQENTQYQKALAAYFEQRVLNFTENNKYQEKFSINLLNLVENFQENFNKEHLKNIQKQWNKDNWFSKLNLHQTEKILQEKHKGLLILVARPEISADCPSSFHHNLKMEIRSGIGSFVENYYPLNSPICPVEYYGDYFQESISKLDVKRLHEIFNSIATLILYSEITDYEVNIHAGFWTIQGKKLEQLSLSGWNWEQTFEQLKQQAYSDKQALRFIRKTIVTAHQFLSGLITDFYYLNLNLLYQPQLEQLQSIFPQEWIEYYFPILQNSYNRNQGEIHYQQGIKLSQSGNHTEALKSFEKALELHSSHQTIFSEKGQIFLNLKKWQDAINNFNQSLQFNAKDVIALKGQGIALFNLLRSEEALNYLEQALELKPDDYEIWTYRGHALYSLARLEEAVKSYEKALSIEPKYLEAINYRRSALHNLGQKENTFIPKQEPSPSFSHQTKIAAHLMPDSPQDWLNLGKTKVKEQQWQDALNCFEQVLKINPNYYEALKGKGLCLFNLKNLNNALNYFNQALKIKATNYRLWNYRGVTLYYLERFSEAIYSYNRALFLNPKSENAIRGRQRVIKKLQCIELKSERDINYDKLRHLLAQGHWKEADKETTNLMLQIVQQGKKIILKLQFKDIEEFPLTDLQTIDYLWKTYSGGHFCFSVQKTIYERLDSENAQFHDDKRWEAFARKVGWFEDSRWLPYEALTFSRHAPLGHLPTGPKFSQPKMLVLLLLKL